MEGLGVGGLGGWGLGGLAQHSPFSMTGDRTETEVAKSGMARLVMMFLEEEDRFMNKLGTTMNERSP